MWGKLYPQNLSHVQVQISSWNSGHWQREERSLQTRSGGGKVWWYVCRTRSEEGLGTGGPIPRLHGHYNREKLYVWHLKRPALHACQLLSNKKTFTRAICLIWMFQNVYSGCDLSRRSVKQTPQSPPPDPQLHYRLGSLRIFPTAFLIWCPDIFRSRIWA